KQQVERLVVTGQDFPQDLIEVIGRATARELADRFATATELRVALGPWRKSAAPSPRARTNPGIEAVHERTVLVVAPRAAEGGRQVPVAEAIHEELLAMLARGRLRVLPRADVSEPADVVLRFAIGDSLTMTAVRAGESAPAATVQLPLEIEHVARSV